MHVLAVRQLEQFKVKLPLHDPSDLGLGSPLLSHFSKNCQEKEYKKCIMHELKDKFL